MLIVSALLVATALGLAAAPAIQEAATPPQGQFGLSRLAVVEPQRDAAFLCCWNRDSEYSRLLDSEPPRFWSEKATQEWLEKHLADLYMFAIGEVGFWREVQAGSTVQLATECSAVPV